MSTQETAKFTVDITLSTPNRGGEFPDDASMEDIIFDALKQEHKFRNYVDVLAVEVKNRTGELDG